MHAFINFKSYGKAVNAHECLGAGNIAMAYLSNFDFGLQPLPTKIVY